MFIIYPTVRKAGRGIETGRLLLREINGYAVKSSKISGFRGRPAQEQSENNRSQGFLRRTTLDASKARFVSRVL